MFLLRLKELIVRGGEGGTHLYPSFIFIYCQDHAILMKVLAHWLIWSKTTCHLLLKTLSARYGAHLAPRDPQTRLEMLSRTLDAGEGIGWDPVLLQRSWKQYEPPCVRFLVILVWGWFGFFFFLAGNAAKTNPHAVTEASVSKPGTNRAWFLL